MAHKKFTFKPIDPQISALAAKSQSNPEAILELLTSLQREQGQLTPDAITDVARALQVPAEHAYGVASFYSMLNVAKGPPAAAPQRTLRTCDGPVCWLCGGAQVRQALDAAFSERPDLQVERTSCLGLCDRAPAVLVDDEQAGPVGPERAHDLFDGWRGRPVDYTHPRPGELRVMMAQAGLVDPDSITSALSHGAYQGLKSAFERTPEAVIGALEASGLTGRGGAGFPAGRKARFVAQADRQPKFVICNADESEPLIFKDRVLIDTHPHQLLEGMAIAGYATGAHQAFIYIRGEYFTQAARLDHAIRQAEAHGWLGNDIQGSGFSFHVHVHRGAGAYICGEETALIESLEGKRGEPRNRPPYPPTAGYHNLPTLVNNVETYSCMPAILANGAEWYRRLSDYPVTGTKMYMVLGHVNQPGLFEAPFGLTLRSVIDDFGGGMRPGSTFQFALTGGAAGTIVPVSLMDVPIDYTSAVKGVSLGAGAFLVCDQGVSPVAFLRELMHFFAIESCGKCTPCRIGTRRSLELLIRLADSKGQVGDVDELLNLADIMQLASFCGLGQSVAIPVKSALTHFTAQFKAAERLPGVP